MDANLQGRDALAKLPELETENIRLRNENAALKGQVEEANRGKDAAIAALRSPVGSQERADIDTEASNAPADNTTEANNASVSTEDTADGTKKAVRRNGRVQ